MAQEIYSIGSTAWIPYHHRVLCLDPQLDDCIVWEEQFLLKISCWSNPTERLSSDLLLPVAHDLINPLFLFPIVKDEFILLIEFVDRFTGYSVASPSQSYIIKIVEKINSSTNDSHCIFLVENQTAQKSIGPFILDSNLRATLESSHNHESGIEHISSHPMNENNNQWTGPTSLNFSLTILSTMTPPSHLTHRSRSVKLLLSPTDTTPIQLLSSLSLSSLSPLFCSCSNLWTKNLLLATNSGMISDIKLSENLKSLFSEKLLLICGRYSWFPPDQLPSEISDLNAIAGPVSCLGTIFGIQGRFTSNVELKPPPQRCECGSFNCNESTCECGKFKPNISSPLYLLIAVCVMLPKRSKKNLESTIEPKHNRRSLFGRDRATPHITGATTTKTLSERFIIWNICTTTLPLPSILSSFGNWEGDFIAFGITAADTSTYYHINSSKPTSSVTNDPWSRPHTPQWSKATKKTNHEVVGNITIAVSNLFDCTNRTSIIDSFSISQRHLCEGNYQDTILSLKDLKSTQLIEFLHLTTVSDRMGLLSYLSQELCSNSLPLSLESMSSLIEEIIQSFFRSPEMSDELMDNILNVLLAKECCHSSLFFFVENWLQKNPFAELLASPWINSFLENQQTPLPSTFNPLKELLLKENEKWSLVFVVCWCVNFLAFDDSSLNLQSKYDLAVLGINLVQSLIRFGLVTLSGWKITNSSSIQIDLFQFALTILRPVAILLPSIVDHDENFKPRSFEFLFTFIKCLTLHPQINLQSQSAVWFINELCHLLIRMEDPTKKTKEHPNCQLHPKRKINQRSYTLGISKPTKNTLSRSSEFSLWNNLENSEYTANLLHFISFLKSSLSSLPSQAHETIATFLITIVHSLNTKLKNLPAEIAVPPKIRKRVEPSSIHVDSHHPQSVISTTLHGIIERGETLPHLNPFDVILLYLGNRGELILSLIELTMVLERDCTRNVLPKHQTVVKENQKTYQDSSIITTTTTMMKMTTHEDRMNRAPADGRVSVKTGRRLVGSTITRRLLGHSRKKPKQPEEIIPIDDVVVAVVVEKLKLDHNLILQILDNFRHLMKTVELHHKKCEDQSPPNSLLNAYSTMCLGVSANLKSFSNYENVREKYLTSTLQRESSRLVAGYETLRIYLLSILTCHQFLASVSSNQNSHQHAEWLAADVLQIAGIVEISNLLLISDPFLNEELIHVHDCHDLILQQQQVSWEAWTRTWFDIVQTLTCLCDSCVSLLSNTTTLPLSQQPIENHLLSDLLKLLEKHCQFTKLQDLQLLKNGNSLKVCGAKGVSHLLGAIETSCRKSKSQHRRSSVRTQNHEFYRQMSQDLQIPDFQNEAIQPEKPNYSHLFRLSLFRCCLNILSVNSQQLDSPLSSDWTIPVVNPEIIWLITDLIVDAIDKWLPLVLPPEVTPLSTMSPEGSSGSLLSFTDISEILNCLKLSLQYKQSETSIYDSHFTLTLSELKTRVFHTLYRWGTYVSTFSHPILLLRQSPVIENSRTFNLTNYYIWTFSIRVAASFSFVDRAIARTPDLKSLLTYLGTFPPKPFQRLEISSTSLGDNIGLYPCSEMVSKLLLELLCGRGERYQRITAMSSKDHCSLPLSGESLFNYSLRFGIESENHHQQIREVLKCLLSSGYWEMGDRIAKAYIDEYRETSRSDIKKKDLSTTPFPAPSAPSASASASSADSASLNGVQDRLTTLIEELDRMADKFQDRILHEGDSRPRPVYFAVRFLISPWKTGSCTSEKIESKFFDFFGMTEFSAVDVQNSPVGKENDPSAVNNLSLVGIGSDELWILIKVDPLAFLEGFKNTPYLVDDIEQNNGPMGTESRLIRHLEAAFPEYVIVPSAVLYPFHRNPIDPSIHSPSSNFRPFSSKIIQVFRAYPNISFDSDHAHLKSFLNHVTTGSSTPSNRRLLSTTSNPHLRRASVSSAGGLVDFSRRRRQKNLSAYSSIMGKPLPSEVSDARNSIEESDFLPLIFDSEKEESMKSDLSAWEVYSYCDSFIIHTELSSELDEIGKDDCISTVTIVLKTSLQSMRHAETTLNDPAELLVTHLNSTVPYRLCLISSVFIFPSVLTHAYCLLRQQLRTVLHCFELLQSCGSVDRIQDDICNIPTILSYVTSAMMGLITDSRDSLGKKPFGIDNSSELISGEGERRSILWQHKRRQFKRELMTTKRLESEDASSTLEPQSELDFAQIEKDFLMTLDDSEAKYLNSMGITIGDMSEIDDTLVNSSNSLYSTVIHLNNGLKSSVTATLSLFRKASLKIMNGNSKELEKRSQRKGSQEQSKLDEGGDLFTTQWMLICLWLEREFQAHL